MDRTREASARRPLKPSLRVARERTQFAIRLLTGAGLLDPNFRLKPDRDTVAIPLIRAPEPGELRTIKNEISNAVLGSDEFPAKDNRPRTLQDALSGIAPDGLISQISKSFDIVGDIAVLEVGGDLAPYWKMIGDALLKIHPNVRAVFAKTGAVSGVERVRPLRHVAGENRTETTHREFGCYYKVDLAKAFFSPRLSTEHQRVAGQVRQGESITDMFAGVGPFSVVIAKTVTNVKIDAIDLNPDAISLLAENIRLNKVSSKVTVHSGDARNIIRTQLRGKMDRIIMNHPSMGKEFLDDACDALKREGGLIHYYTFAGGESSEESARSELEKVVEGSNHHVDRIVRTHKVREVAPMKWQVSVDASIIP